MDKLKDYFQKISSSEISGFKLNFPHSDSEVEQLWKLYDRINNKKEGEFYRLTFEDIHSIFRMGKLLKSQKLTKISEHDKKESIRIANEPRFNKKQKKIEMFIQWAIRTGLYTSVEEIHSAKSLPNEVIRKFFNEFKDELKLNAKNPINSLRNTFYNHFEIGK